LSADVPNQEKFFTIPATGIVDLIVEVPGAISVESVLDSEEEAIAFVFDASAQKVYIDSAALTAATAGQATITFTIAGAGSAIGDLDEVTLTNDNFPTAMKLVGTSFVIEEKTGKKKRIQIEIPKFKINSNFSFTMDAEGDASVFDFNGVALVQDGELMKIQFLGDYDYDVNA
jgi:hypothetical protein